MHDPRTSSTLRTLAQLTGDPPPRRWAWSVGRLDAAGRVGIGRRTADVFGPFRLRWHGLALVVEPASPEDSVATFELDPRGRLLVPTWLRDRGPDVVIGVDIDRRRILIAPVEVLDRLGDVLAGDR